MLKEISKLSVTFSRFVGVTSILFLVSAAYAQNTLTITVNCNNGQSLNRTLSELNKQTPVTKIVQGTCTEFVTIDGFESLTLRGQSGAAIEQPATNPHSNPFVLSITGSRGITVSNLVVHGPSGIGIGKGSSEVLLKGVDVDDGIVVYEESQVWLVKVIREHHLRIRGLSGLRQIRCAHHRWLA